MATFSTSMGGKKSGLLPTPNTTPFSLSFSQSQGQTQANPQSAQSQNSQMQIEKFPKSSLYSATPIGQGGFGNVVKGTLNNQHVIVKILHAPIGLKRYGVLQEIFNLKHRNIVKLIGMIDTDTKIECPQLIFQDVNGGNLLDYLKRSLGPTDDLTLTKLGSDIVNGMEYLHSQNFIHGCLAARNILLDKFHEYTNAKISDYGMPRVIQGTGANYPSTFANVSKTMPIRWLPKEAILTLEKPRGEIEKSADVWSFGVVFWEIWTRGQVPYASVLSNTDVKQHILDGSCPLSFARPENCPQGAITIMQNIFAINDQQRPTFFDLKGIFDAVLKSMRPPQPARATTGASARGSRGARNSASTHTSANSEHKSRKLDEFRGNERGRGGRQHSGSGSAHPYRGTGTGRSSSRGRGHDKGVGVNGPGSHTRDRDWWDTDEDHPRRHAASAKPKDNGNDNTHRIRGGGDIRKTNDNGNRSREKENFEKAPHQGHVQVPNSGSNSNSSVSNIPRSQENVKNFSKFKPQGQGQGQPQADYKIPKSKSQDARLNPEMLKKKTNPNRVFTQEEMQRQAAAAVDHYKLKLLHKKLEAKLSAPPSAEGLQTTTKDLPAAGQAGVALLASTRDSEASRPGNGSIYPIGMAPPPPYTPLPPKSHSTIAMTMTAPLTLPAPAASSSSTSTSTSSSSTPGDSSDSTSATPTKKQKDKNDAKELEKTVKELQAKIAAMEVKQKVSEIEGKVKSLETSQSQTQGHGQRQLFTMGQDQGHGHGYVSQDHHHEAPRPRPMPRTHTSTSPYASPVHDSNSSSQSSGRQHNNKNEGCTIT